MLVSEYLTMENVKQVKRELFASLLGSHFPKSHMYELFIAS
ncbi:unnamed protein product [Arabidopsis halleri]